MLSEILLVPHASTEDMMFSFVYPFVNRIMEKLLVFIS